MKLSEDEKRIVKNIIENYDLVRKDVEKLILDGNEESLSKISVKLHRELLQLRPDPKSNTVKYVTEYLGDIPVNTAFLFQYCTYLLPRKPPLKEDSEYRYCVSVHKEMLKDSDFVKNLQSAVNNNRSGKLTDEVKALYESIGGIEEDYNI